MIRIHTYKLLSNSSIDLLVFHNIIKISNHLKIVDMINSNVQEEKNELTQNVNQIPFLRLKIYQGACY